EVVVDGGVVDQYVDALEALDRSRRHVQRAALVGDVEPQRERLGAGGGALVRDALRRLLAQIGDDDMRSLPCESQGVGPADALRRSRDDGDFLREPHAAALAPHGKGCQRLAAIDRDYPGCSSRSAFLSSSSSSVSNEIVR